MPARKCILKRRRLCSQVKNKNLDLHTWIFDGKKHVLRIMKIFLFEKKRFKSTDVNDNIKEKCMQESNIHIFICVFFFLVII